jgi:hypothetical protein
VAGQAGTLELLVRELAQAIKPLEDKLASGDPIAFIEELGVRLPATVAADAQLGSALGSTASTAGALEPAIEALVAAIAAEDPVKIISAGEALIAKLGGVLSGLAAINSSLTAALGGAGGLTQAQRTELENFAAELPRKLLDYMLVEYLRAKGPTIMPTLSILGIVDDLHTPSDPSNPVAVPAIARAVHLDRLVNGLLNPTAYLEDAFALGSHSFDGLLLFTRVQQYLTEMDLPVDVIVAPGQPAILEAYLLRLSVDPLADPPALTLRLRFSATEDFQQTYPLGSLWNLELSAKARFDAGLEGKVTPPLDIALSPPTGTVSVEVEIGMLASNPGGTVVLFAEAGATKLEATQLGLSLGVTATGGTAGASAEPSVSGQLTGGHLKIDLSEGDGFISTITGGANIDANLELKFHWSPNSGFQVQGSSAVQIAIPTHISIGPIEVEKLYLQLGLEGAALPAELSGAFSVELGPLTASVDRIGLQVITTFPTDSGGNLGPVNLALAFKPPTGVGLSLEASIVTGGGFLSLDTARGEYSGALQLELAEIVAVSAIGLITTKNPDGSPGFSLLIIITAEFGPGIQLGFGFTLNAVGGLVGVNRTMLAEALMEATRTDAIEGIMFPKDVVANAQRIISDLRAIFPPKPGTFLIGPMAKLGWGEPTLVSVSLGVIVEIPPGDIAILGVLKVVLPAEELEVLRLQVNFAGELEFSKSRLYFYATLYDSHLLFITIQGGMGLLVAWGDEPNFVVSVGGFNPHYVPPPLPFPTPQRLQVDILNESFARIRAEGYFAVTSNTVQFGSHTEMFFGFSALSVEGQTSFDALIQFSPFMFIVEISTSFSVKVFGLGVWGVGMSLTVEGPTPWHIHGSASISLLFFSIEVPVDITFGEARNTTLPPVAVMPILAEEFGKRSNWKAQLPVGSHLLVSLRALDPAEADLVLHPVGTLQVSQRAIPLELTLDKVGSQRPRDANRFELIVTSPGMTKTRELQEQFAPAQFIEAEDAAKLSEPAFSPQDSGLELAPEGQVYASATEITRVVRYELTIIDTKLVPEPTRERFRGYPVALFEHEFAGASVARSLLSTHREELTHPNSGSVTVKPESYAVAHQADNTPVHPAGVTFTSRVAAIQHLNGVVASEPALAGTLHVLPEYELQGV